MPPATPTVALASGRAAFSTAVRTRPVPVFAVAASPWLLNNPSTRSAAVDLTGGADDPEDFRAVDRRELDARFELGLALAAAELGLVLPAARDALALAAARDVLAPAREVDRPPDFGSDRVAEPALAVAGLAEADLRLLADRVRGEAPEPALLRAALEPELLRAALEPELLPAALEPDVLAPAPEPDVLAPALELDLLPAAAERAEGFRAEGFRAEPLADEELGEPELALPDEPPLVDPADRERDDEAEAPLLEPDEERFLELLRRGVPLSFSTAIFVLPIDIEIGVRCTSSTQAHYQHTRQKSPALGLPDARPVYT